MQENLKKHILERWIIAAMFILLPIMSVFSIPAKYVIISLLFVVVFIGYYKSRYFRVIAHAKPLLIWLVLTIYQWGNAMYKHVPEVDVYDLLHGLKIYACIAFFAFVSFKYLNKTVFSLLIVFTFFFILSFVVNDKSSNNRLTGVIYATALGQTAALSGVYVAYYCVLNNINFKKSSLFYILPLIVILSTQSRNSLAMLFIIIIGHYLAHNSKKGLKIGKLFVFVCIISIISFLLLSVILEHTEIGQRFNGLDELEESQAVNGIATGTIFDTIVGDRLRYYILGWFYFLDSPWTGIGMWNFKYVAGGIFPLHTEYMVQLCEGGIIAFTLWVWFFVVVFKGILKSSQPFHLKIIAIFSIVAILFCGVYARVFYYEFFYPIIGIAISFSPSINKKFIKL